MHLTGASCGCSFRESLLWLLHPVLSALVTMCLAYCNKLRDVLNSFRRGKSFLAWAGAEIISCKKNTGTKIFSMQHHDILPETDSAWHHSNILKLVITQLAEAAWRSSVSCCLFFLPSWITLLRAKHWTDACRMPETSLWCASPWAYPVLLSPIFS